VRITGRIVAYSAAVADLPLELPAPYADALLAALDTEGKIQRALETLGPVAGRDDAVIGGGPVELARFEAVAHELTPFAPATEPGSLRMRSPDASFDAVVARWSAFNGVDSRDLAEADRVLRPDGRLLVVHDYGRDDVSRLRGDLPEYRLWSRRDGPFLSVGFRIRVVHCFWTFPSLDDAAAFLTGAFGEVGAAVAATLKRPRLSYNVAVYHRTRGDGAGAQPAP
jgi:SAM-dependent methyltransferase